MRVRDCMSSPVQVIGPDAPAWEALGLMRRHRFRRLPVVEGGRLVGILTWTDVVRVQPPVVGTQRQVPGLSVGVQVRHLMTPSPRVVEPDAPIEHAAALMRRHKIGGLPVVEGGRLVGIVTESDIFEVFAEVLGTGPHEVRLQVAVGSISVELPRITGALVRAAVPVLSLQTLRVRGTEGIGVVVHERDARRTREALERLALDVQLQPGLAEGAEG
jgi:acetoin utilization protein AcuB